MNISIVLGYEDSLLPSQTACAEMASYLSSDNQTVGAPLASWISKRCGMYSHEFLLDQDAGARLEVFSEFLRASFGSTIPLLAFPRALDVEQKISPDTHALLQELLSLLEPCSVDFVVFGSQTGEMSSRPPAHLGRDLDDLCGDVRHRIRFEQPPLETSFGRVIATNSSHNWLRRTVDEILEAEGCLLNGTRFADGLHESLRRAGVSVSRETGKPLLERLVRERLSNAALGNFDKEA